MGGGVVVVCKNCVELLLVLLGQVAYRFQTTKTFNSSRSRVCGGVVWEGCEQQ